MLASNPGHFTLRTFIVLSAFALIPNAARANPTRFEPPGQCIPLPPRPSEAKRTEKIPADDDMDREANTFRGDLDGDGVPDRILIVEGKNPSNDPRPYFHLFVMRGNCGHWVGGFIATNQKLTVARESDHGLRRIQAQFPISKGAQIDEFAFDGQTYRRMRYKVLGGHAIGWVKEDQPQPAPARPMLDATQKPQQPAKPAAPLQSER